MHDPEIQSFNLSFKFVLFYRMLIFVSFKTGDNGDFNVQIWELQRNGRVVFVARDFLTLQP